MITHNYNKIIVCRLFTITVILATANFSFFSEEDHKHKMLKLAKSNHNKFQNAKLSDHYYSKV